MASTAPQSRDNDVKFERSNAEDTIVLLNQLCTTCARFTETSKLLQKFSRQERIKHLEDEVVEICSAEQLKAGYLNGCHLCTLFWRTPDGPLFHGDLEANSDRLKVALTAIARDASGQGDTMNRLPFVAATGSLRIMLLNAGETLKTKNRTGIRLIEAYLETNPSLNRNVLGRLKEPISSKSETKISQIVDWYHECTTKHVKCGGFSTMVAPSQQRPSRLLDLGDNKLRLECDVQGILSLRYATLSHVWGSDPGSYPQLKEASLKAFEAEVLLDSLPVKYKDCIRITRALGIRYLWIDSLCIIQDSSKDWKTEALKMAGVYGCSACNISYTHSPSEEPAKNYLRDPRLNLPCKLAAASARPSRLSAFGVKNSVMKHLPPVNVVVQSMAGAMHGSWSTEGYRRASPLLSRAWVFQERLLCPRTIYYGHDRLLWECCETFNDEFSGRMPHVPRSKAQIYSAFSGVAQDQSLVRVLGHFDGQWKSIVNDYRTCKLTFETDRAIAFAGIASAIQSQTKMTFLAGIWREAAHLDLLWCVTPSGPKRNQKVTCSETQGPPKVPSWSWFSIPCPLDSDYDVVNYFLSTTAALRSKETLYRATVLSFEHPRLLAEPEALFYDFEGLELRLSTHKIPAVLRWENDVVQLMPHGQAMLPEGLENYNLYDPRSAMKCNLDDLSLNVNEELPQNTSMILLVVIAYHENRIGRSRTIKFTDPIPENNEEASDWRTRYLFSGLVVVPDENCVGWKRVGVYSFEGPTRAATAEIAVPFDFESGEPDEMLLK